MKKEAWAKKYFIQMDFPICFKSNRSVKKGEFALFIRDTLYMNIQSNWKVKQLEYFHTTAKQLDEPRKHHGNMFIKRKLEKQHGERETTGSEPAYAH